MSLKAIAISSVIVFALVFAILIILHELHITKVNWDISPKKTILKHSRHHHPSIDFITDSISLDAEEEYLPADVLSKVEDRRGKRGLLTCNGTQIDSEVIYWRIVPGDNDFESPITVHHGNHDDRYFTFEYDHGGWNNVSII